MESGRIFSIFCKQSSLEIMAIQFSLFDFCITKLPIFDSDFNDENSSLVKFKGAAHFLYELNDESTLFLILDFKFYFF